MNLRDMAVKEVEKMFSAMDGWTVGHDIYGVSVGGGNVGLSNDPRMSFWEKSIGGFNGKSILELGPMECHHTNMMHKAGAIKITAIEGIRECFIRCLIVKEVFALTRSEIIFGDFCDWVESWATAGHSGLLDKYDAVLTSGVLYHQTNPAKLIHDLAKITDVVMVWSHVAGLKSPNGAESTIEHDGKVYKGKINNYGGTRGNLVGYCGGLNDTAFWMYPDEMRRCFKDAGFTKFVDQETQPNKNGESVLFVASK